MYDIEMTLSSHLSIVFKWIILQFCYNFVTANENGRITAKSHFTESLNHATIVFGEKQKVL